MKKLTQGIAIAAAVGLSGLAQAAFIDVTPNAGGALAPVAADNSYANPDGNGSFVPGAPLYTLADSVLESYSVISTSASPFKLTFTYLGKEAAYTGSFKYKGSEVFNTGTSALGASFSTVYSDGLGLLDFGFSSVTSGGAGAGSVDNGPGNLAPDYSFTIFEGGEDYLILSLDDNHKVDDNHDDMIVMVKASRVPEPGSLALLGLGLAGMALRFKGKK